MRLRGTWNLWILVIILFIAFLLRGIFVPDPDFGWHIRAGENILQHGIPISDPFSYSMPSYPFIDHEWLTNVLTASIYNHWGFAPLLVFYSFLAVAALVLQRNRSKKTWSSLILVLAGGTFFQLTGLRTQVLTWFFLSLLLCVLFDNKIWQKWRYALPVLFLLWANLHGGFGIGLGVLGIVLVGKTLEEKKFVNERLLILVLCIWATLVNPFGTHLWWEFWMQLTDNQLRWSIAEWYPAWEFINLAFWIYFSLSLFLITRYRNRYTWTELFLYAFLLVEGMLSLRNIPLWVLASYAMTMRGLGYLEQDAAKHAFGKERLASGMKGFFIISLFFVLPQVGLFFYSTVVWKDYQYYYPVKAVAYLHQHMPQQQIFSYYDWGGYLDWRLPEKKVFIDGRMPSWRWQASIPGESNYAFVDYKKVLNGQIPFAAFVQQYKISTLLVPVAHMAKPKTQFLGMTVPADSFWGKLFFSEISFYTVVLEAKKQGWQEVYHDQTAVILEKP